MSTLLPRCFAFLAVCLVSCVALAAAAKPEADPNATAGDYKLSPQEALHKYQGFLTRSDIHRYDVKYWCQDLPIQREYQAEDYAAQGVAVVKDEKAPNGKSVHLAKPGDSFTIEMDMPSGHWGFGFHGRQMPDEDKQLCFELDVTGPNEFKRHYRTRAIIIPKNKEDWWPGYYLDIARIYVPMYAAGKYRLTFSLGARSRVGAYVDRVAVRDVTAHLPQGTGKTSRVLISDKEVATIRANVARYEWAQKTIAKTLEEADKWVAMSDEDLWNFVPDPNEPRDQDDCFPCPECGWKVKKVYAAHPWYGTAKDNWKVRCPVCKKLFPSNDYAAGDMTTGPNADDGWGYRASDEPGRGKRGDENYTSPSANESFFIASYRYQKYWYVLRSGMGGKALPEKLAWAYIYTGDERYAHKAGVLIAALANAYPGLDFQYQQVNKMRGDAYGSRGAIWRYQSPYVRWGAAVGKDTYAGWSAGVAATWARTYDLIYPAVRNDKTLAAFVATKVPTVRTPQDVCHRVEIDLLDVIADACARRQIRAEEGGWEEAMTTAVTVLQSGQAFNHWMRELNSFAFANGINSGGLGDSIVDNLYREGVNSIGSIMYCTLTIDSYGKVMDMLMRLRESGADVRLDRAALDKIDAAAFFVPDCYFAGGLASQIGDMGRMGFLSANSNYYLYGQDEAIANGFVRTREPRLAIVLKGKLPPEVLLRIDPAIGRQAEEIYRTQGPALSLRTRDVPGFGLAQLEAGWWQADLAKRRGISFRYGVADGHAHRDTLSYEFAALGRKFIGGSAYFGGGWAPHHQRMQNNVEIDDTELTVQTTGASASAHGYLHALDALPGVTFVDGEAKQANYAVDTYRRFVALIDVSPDNSYVFDVFRVAGGGKRHAYDMHSTALGPYTFNVTMRKLDANNPGDKDDLDYMAKFRTIPTFPDSKEVGVTPADGPLETIWTAKKGALGVREDYAMRSTLYGAPGQKLLSCVTQRSDTEMYPIMFEFVLNRPADGASTFTQLLEAYHDKPLLTARTEVPVTRDGKPVAGSAAVRVLTAEGRTDLLAYDVAPADKPCKAGEMTFAGNFALASSGPAGVGLTIAGGPGVEYDGRALQLAPGRYTGAIVKADYEGHRILVDGTFPAEYVRGRTLAIGFGHHRVGYVAVGADPAPEKGHTWINLDGANCIFQSAVESVDAKAQTVKPAMFPPLAWRPDPRYYDDATVTNEAGTKHWHMKGLDDKGALKLDGPVAAADFTDVDGDGRTMVYINDFGPGDAVSLWAAAKLTPVGKDLYHLAGNADVTLMLPTPAAQVWCLDPQHNWRAVRGAQRKGVLTLRVQLSGFGGKTFLALSDDARGLVGQIEDQAANWDTYGRY